MTNKCRTCLAVLGDDATICRECIEPLEQALAETEAIVRELHVTLARQATRTDPMGTKTAATGDEARTLDAPSLGVHTQKLPYDLGASESLTELRAVLVSWAKLLIEERGDGKWPKDTLPAIAAFLLANLERLRHHEIAHEAVQEITNALTRVKASNDRHVDRWYVGDCRAGDCREAVYCAAGATTAVCWLCGTVHDVESRRSAMFDEMLGMRMTVAECVAAVARYGPKVSEWRIRQWVSRGRLTAHGVNSDGTPTYLLHEVVDLLDTMQSERDAG